jgi:hypothetical protein
MHVEPDGLLVLLIHVKICRAEVVDCVGEQPAPAALSAPCRVHEQHFDLVLGYGNKSRKLIIRITYTRKPWYMGKRIPHQGSEELNIRLAHEMMCCANRSLPHFYNLRELVGVDGKDAGL